MIWAALEEERCVGCERTLHRPEVDAQREDVRFTGGEAVGWRGVAIIARCGCGLTTIVALSADVPSAA